MVWGGVWAETEAWTDKLQPQSLTNKEFERFSSPPISDLPSNSSSSSSPVKTEKILPQDETGTPSPEKSSEGNQRLSVLSKKFHPKCSPHLNPKLKETAGATLGLTWWWSDRRGKGTGRLQEGDNLARGVSLFVARSSGRLRASTRFLWVGTQNKARLKPVPQDQSFWGGEASAPKKTRDGARSRQGAPGARESYLLKRGWEDAGAGPL